MEWELGEANLKGEDLYSLYLMNVADQSEKQIQAIETTIEDNPRYREVFPGVIPDKEKGWTKQVIFVKGRKAPDKEANIFGTGFLGPYQGYHFHRIYVDDPTDPEDVLSETKMESQRERLRGMLLDRKRVKGKIRVILTPWGATDLRRTFKEMGFRIIENPVEGHYQWGRLLFPEILPDDRLEEIARQKGSALYRLTYMLQEDAAEGALIKRAYWKLFQPDKTPLFSLKLQLWDIAVTAKETADYSVCGTWGLAENGYYLLDVERRKVDTPELIKWMIRAAEDKRPDYIAVLTTGVGRPVYDMLRERTRLPLVEAPVESKDPRVRLQEVLPIIEAGRVYLPVGASWVETFLDETAMYTGMGNAHDDQVAMLVGSLRWLKDRQWQAYPVATRSIMSPEAGFRGAERESIFRPRQGVRSLMDG